MKNSLWLLVLVFVCHSKNGAGQATTVPRFKALALFENGGHHLQYSIAAKRWLNALAADSSFSVDFINNTDPIDSNYLKKYQLFIQLDYPPYAWKERAVIAFQQYIEQGRGGWIGFHHATLLGEFDGYPMWQWFWSFMGKIRFTNYIPRFADGRVTVDRKSVV